jgi:hypothetical protein
MAKLTFKREPRITGLASSAYNDEKRICYIRMAGEEVGYIFNRAHSYVLHGEDVWRVTMFALVDMERRNVTLKGKFATLDEAKDFVKKNWQVITDKWELVYDRFKD